ncbi:MAG: peptidylprolyl isomerase [Planctomycetota bacterium]
MITKTTVQRVLVVLAMVAPAFAADVIKIDIWDQRVAIVNTEAICKRDVEERMGGLAEHLWAFKRKKIEEKSWTPEAEVEWTKLYVEGFRDALRKIVRERLMMQHFTLEKMALDDKNVQKRQAGHLKMLRDNGVKNIDVVDVGKRIRESMTLEEFRGKFDNAMEYPKKPEVEKYYADNIDKYQRKAGVKIRVIRIDPAYIDKVTGVKVVRDNPYGMLEDIRRDIVNFGASFSEVAKTKTDDVDLKATGGLIINVNKDPYIVVEDYNKVLANATRNLKNGEVSPIFPYGNGYAIAMVEDRRETGPESLEGKLYDKIFDEMYQSKRIRKEDEWFRKTLAKTLVMQIVEGTARPLPIEFFFPDDKKNPDFINNSTAAASADKKAKDKEKEPK